MSFKLTNFFRGIKDKTMPGEEGNVKSQRDKWHRVSKLKIGGGKSPVSTF